MWAKWMRREEVLLVRKRERKGIRQATRSASDAQHTQLVCHLCRLFKHSEQLLLDLI